ncbi:MAG: hypothetical protein Q9160_007584 [Pyrenula sp. 1 TL-2023]
MSEEIQEKHFNQEFCDAQVERRVKWKLDLTILPLLTSIYFLSQLAKSDLGNAKVAGMSEELHLSAKDYSNLAIMITVGELLFQLPGTILLKKIGPSYQFGGAMVVWGIVTACIVAAKTQASIMVLRALTGAAEAFIRGVLIYLSFWYRYNELATRGALFDATAALGGAFNGVLGNAIQVHLEGHNGWRAWRWIFLIEGVVPIGWGLVVAFALPSTPESVGKLFSPEEKEVVVRRSRAAHNTSESKIRPKAMLQVLADPTFWMLAGIQSSVDFTISSLANFLPPILEGLGWEDEKAQLMSSVVYASAFVNIIFCARIADKTAHRSIPILVNCCIAIVGFVLLLCITDPAGRFVATCVLTAALYPCLLLATVWLAINQVGYSHRTSAFAFANIASKLFSIVGNKVYIDPPFYHLGLAVSTGMTVLAAILTILLIWRLKVLNRSKIAERDSTRGQELAQRSIDEIGNKHPHFMYGF